MEPREIILAPEDREATCELCERERYSEIRIGEDLRRAIIALRSVPTANWSVESLHGNDCAEENGTVSVEYVWKAKCFDRPGKCSFSTHSTDRETVIFTDERQLKHRCIPLVNGIGGEDAQTETKQRDSSTQHLDGTSNRICRQTEHGANYVHLSPVCQDDRSKEIDLKDTQPLNYILASVASLPPQPCHLKDPTSRRYVEGKLETDGKHKVKKIKKTGTSLPNTSEDISDIYERSLEILEDDPDEDLDCSSIRSDSPECLMEEVLDSIPADEFDILPSGFDNISVIKMTGRDAEKSDDSVFEAATSDRSSAEKELSVKTPKTCEMTTFMLTGIKKCDNETQVEKSNVKNNEEIQCRRKGKDADRQEGQGRGWRGAAAGETAPLVPPKLWIHLVANGASANELRKKELTPEDIFEEIMDSMEATEDTVQGDVIDWSNKATNAKNNPNKKGDVQRKVDERSASDLHSLENEWLSVYYSRFEAGNVMKPPKKKKVPTATLR